MNKKNTDDGARIYTPLTLKLYDWWVYLLHCLPGNISTKSCVIRNAAQALTDDGTLYGATILGDGVVHNSFGQKLMRIYNQKGIFSNTKDSEEGLTHILSEHFENVKTKVQGTVVMFSASGKK
ncbi:hypothetical protein P2P32_18780 [Escherichia coli]